MMEDPGVENARGERPARPVKTPPRPVLDDVTKGYVPWSTSSRRAFAPSMRMLCCERDLSVTVPLATGGGGVGAEAFARRGV
jgi:hypothetical protein